MEAQAAGSQAQLFRLHPHLLALPGKTSLHMLHPPTQLSQLFHQQQQQQQ
jgi:hypothetical protein